MSEKMVFQKTVFAAYHALESIVSWWSSLLLRDDVALWRDEKGDDSSARFHNKNHRIKIINRTATAGRFLHAVHRCQNISRPDPSRAQNNSSRRGAMRNDSQFINWRFVSSGFTPSTNRRNTDETPICKFAPVCQTFSGFAGIISRPGVKWMLIDVQ